MEDAKFDLPIRGTLKKPKIDGEALKEHWKSVGVDLLGDSMKAGVDGLQRLLQGMPVPGLRGLLRPGRRADPPAPPRPGRFRPARGATAPGTLEVAPSQSTGSQAASDGRPNDRSPLTAGQRKQLRQERRKGTTSEESRSSSESGR